MSAPIWKNLLLFVLLNFLLHENHGVRRFTVKAINEYRERVVKMFQHAYNGYLEYAYPYDELRPLTCDGQDTWGSYSLTLIDALDTLAIMGNYSEFQRVAQLIIDTADFDIDINASVFETNIRIVGGLLSAHLLTHKAGMKLETGWPCSGPLLRLAEDTARRLLPAFNTSTGMPYGTVNLRYGVPKGETPVTCTAGVGTFIVEFGTLSSLTGDPVFEQTASKALSSLWSRRSTIGLIGNHINVETGKWTAVDAGIGAGVDSYFEYLVKGSILFNTPHLMSRFHSHVKTFEKYLKTDDWYMWANMNKGLLTLPLFQSLEAYWPGVQSLVGDIDKAMKTLHNYHQVWKQYGFTPEFYNIQKNAPQLNREGYPLRPELIESTMYLYRATKDPFLLEVGVDILESIEHSTKTRCGYATVKNVLTHQLENRMESFFLAETTKYLYLLFAPDNFIHNTGGHGEIVKTTHGECVIDAGGYVFNTEAHPVDSAALYCCSALKKEHDKLLQDYSDNVNLLSLLDLEDPEQEVFASKSKKMKDKMRKKKEKQNEKVLKSQFPNGPEGGSTITISGSSDIKIDKISIDKIINGEDQLNMKHDTKLQLNNLVARLKQQIDKILFGKEKETSSKGETKSSVSSSPDDDILGKVIKTTDSDHTTKVTDTDTEYKMEDVDRSTSICSKSVQPDNEEKKCEVPSAQTESSASPEDDLLSNNGILPEIIESDSALELDESMSNDKTDKFSSSSSSSSGSDIYLSSSKPFISENMEGSSSDIKSKSEESPSSSSSSSSSSPAASSSTEQAELTNTRDLSSSSSENDETSPTSASHTDDSASSASSESESDICPVGGDEDSVDPDEEEDEECKSDNAQHLVCPAQPFHSRLSIYGEMFLDVKP